MRLLRLTAIGAVAALVTACSGVPSSSSPEVVRNSVGGPTQAPIDTVSPQPGAEPRAIVQDFLLANLSTADDKHAAAKQFLTPEARTKWSDNAVTVVDSFQQIGLPDPSTHAVTLTANKIGTISAQGIYAPAEPAEGTTFTFGLSQLNGQWRIDQLQPGVVITQADLGSVYKMYPLYFFDLSAQRLVADPRYSPLSGQALVSWLLTQLFAGPRPELQTAVLALPGQLNTRSASVAIGTAATVDLPGIGQLDNDSKQRVAAQLATTIGAAGGLPIKITESQRPISIAGLDSPFTSDDFAVYAGAGFSAAPFYVSDDGRVMTQDGTPLNGPLGKRGYGLTGVGLAQDPAGSTNYLAAGIAGPAKASRLLLGTAAKGLRDSGLAPGPMAGPSWAPGQSEVWVGSGAAIWRASIGSAVVRVPVNAPSAHPGTIRALKFSRDGVRIAIVMTNLDGTAQAYVGTVERSGKNARVDNLVAISPSTVNVNDIAWNDDTTLYAVGTAANGYGVWSVQSDGSLWNQRSRTNLPQAAQQIAAARDQYPWVSAGGVIFVQRSSTWVSPFGPPDSTVRGTSPTYLD
jgi:hypothetical protein